VSLVWLTGIRISSPWMSWPRGELAALPKGTQLTADTSKGHVLFILFGCINCHPLGERGTGVGPNLAGYKFRLSPSELENYILSPPDGVAMPPYRGRMTPQELKSTVEFVLVAQTFPRKY
ncbi:MAG: cytochrome c, partial [Deltaproteobacteria bacterium]|nr:cytochrome c [Deltaproteobacteria bacterium]